MLLEGLLSSTDLLFQVRQKTILEQCGRMATQRGKQNIEGTGKLARRAAEAGVGSQLALFEAVVGIVIDQLLGQLPVGGLLLAQALDARTLLRLPRYLSSQGGQILVETGLPLLHLLAGGAPVCNNALPRCRSRVKRSRVTARLCTRVGAVWLASSPTWSASRWPA